MSGRASVQASDLFAGWFDGADGYAQAFEKHTSSSKPLVVYFYTDWCPYCRRLENEILGVDQVKECSSSLPGIRTLKPC